MNIDANTILQMMGLFSGGTGGANPEAQPRRYTPGLADFSQLGNSAANVPAPVAAPVVPQDGMTPMFGHGTQGNSPHVLSAASTAPAAPTAPVAPVAPTMPVHKGGFSTGNILTALLGSNFGQK